jgi:4'-phosphopantetheinyl transferase
VIDLWLYPLDVPPAPFAALLSPAERDQAARFRFARDRDRFIARRGQLRSLLAEYLDCPAAAIEWHHGPHGKPSVRGLHFSVSHSAGLGLCAISRAIEIGCDLEHHDPALADRAVAERLFSPAEWHSLQALPPEQWAEGFFQVWTRKEAFVKAIGLGLSYPLDAFDVSVAQDARLLRGGEDWSIKAITTIPGYHAALVAKGEAAQTAGPPKMFSAGSAPAAKAAA